MKPDTPGLPTESEKDQPRGSAPVLNDANLPSYYVGIGASAGGLEAIETFFKNMPSHSGLAFIIVQHLSPDYKSMMVELLSKHTAMPVRRVENGMKVVANAIRAGPFEALRYDSFRRRRPVAPIPVQVFHAPGGFISDRTQYSRNGGFRSAQPDQGSLLSPYRTGQLPQPADLPPTGFATQDSGKFQLFIEELQATNEELLASNEKLQSTNEELQSVNEELHTVNTEHQRKIMEMTELNNDLRNLMENTGAGALFVDENLEIRKYTPRMAQLFNISDTDIGRSIARLSIHLGGLDPVGLIARIHGDHQPLEEEVHLGDGRWCLVRALPYRIGPQSYSGSIMIFSDITERKTRELMCQAQVAKFRTTFERASMGIALLDMRGYLLESNTRLNEMLGYTVQELSRQPFVAYTHGRDSAAAFALFKEIQAGERDFFQIPACYMCKNGDPLQVNLTFLLIRDAGGRPGYTIGLLESVTGSDEV
jgi:PAS domain S-box-containing protein